MRKWKSHKIVEAEVITGWDFTRSRSGKLDIVDVGFRPDAERIEVPATFFARGKPDHGDYLVRYEHGYLSWSPKAAFEAAGYTLYKDPALDFGITVSYRGLAFTISEEDIEDNLATERFQKGWAALNGKKATGSMMGDDGEIYSTGVDPASLRASLGLRRPLPADASDHGLHEVWEYIARALPLHPNNFNDLGKDGWELVAALEEWAEVRSPFNSTGKGNRLFIFKRRNYA